MSSNEGRQPLHLLASEGGNGEFPEDSRDPFEVLDDLMQVVEALCPTFPERDTFADSTVQIVSAARPRERLYAFTDGHGEGP